MNPTKSPFTAIFAVSIALMATFSVSNVFAQANKPNIVFIMGDDIGMWNIGAYHRGMMAGKTPNLDKLAKEGMLFTDYYAEASCTAGRANFITVVLSLITLVGRYYVAWRTRPDRTKVQYRALRVAAKVGVYESC